MPGNVKIPEITVDGIEDPKLKPPKKKDLKLGLERSTEDALDQFSQGPSVEAEKTEVSGDFETRGLGLGSGASRIPVLEVAERKERVVEANAGGLKVEPPAENQAEKIEVAEGVAPTEATPSVRPGEMSQEELDELTDALYPEETEEPTPNLESLLASFAAVRQTLNAFDAALSQSVARMQMPQIAGEGLSDDVKRAIIETAENTAQLAERARTGGFVFS
jgi:hypothetical protein